MLSPRLKNLIQSLIPLQLQPIALSLCGLLPPQRQADLARQIYDDFSSHGPLYQRILQECRGVLEDAGLEPKIQN